MNKVLHIFAKKVEKFRKSLPKSHTITNIGIFTNGILVFLIILSIAITPFHFIDKNSEFFHFIQLLDFFIVKIFIFEYLFRIWLADRPLKFMTSLEGIIDFLTLFSFFISQLIAFDSYLFFIGIRIFRIMKFHFYNDEETIFHNILNSDSEDLPTIQGEKVLGLIKRHSIFLFVRTIIPITLLSFSMMILFLFYEAIWGQALAIILFLMSIMIFLRCWIDFSYDVILLTNFRIILQDRKVFGEKINSFEYKAVTNIIPSNIGIFRALFNIGNITIETANRDQTVEFNFVKNPSRIVSQIYSYRNFKHKEEALLNKDLLNS